MQTNTDITIRPAGYSDARALLALAALDSAQVPDGPLLVAETGGELVAAVSVGGDAVIADPFRRTAGIVSMLRLRAAQLRAESEAAADRPALARRALGAMTARPQPRLP
jgi:hypothetical protein